jgi:hypothetical protein
MRYSAVVAAIALAISASSAFARMRLGERGGLENCALASQREVARRHGFRAGEDNSSKIYANPAWAAEADNLFDACVKR